MLRLPKLDVREPESLPEALALLAALGDRAKIVAGGTDLLPNLKHEIATPEVLVALWRVPDLVGVDEDASAIRIGAMTSLAAVAADPIVHRVVPVLGQAVATVAGPQLRRMGTLGGNVCLDTRCVYINQSYFWRQALGFCLKKDGTVCHVVAGGQRCVAAASNDSGPVLLALDARLVLASPRGERVVSVDDFYRQDGVLNQRRAPDEILIRVEVPRPRPGTSAAYEKLRARAAIDFPELGVMALAELDGARVLRLEVALTALASRPVRVRGLEALAGRALDQGTIREAAELAFQRAKPLTNLASDPEYRRDMVRVLVGRALGRIARGAA